MLVQFTVGNFKSFREKATLSMEATSDDWLQDDNVAVVGSQRFIKSAAIYGANAGGKSNYLAALAFFQRFVKSSSKESQQGEKIGVDPFRLHTDTESAPTFFEMVFMNHGTRYRYGFQATSTAVQSEWLFSRQESTRETRLFTRENKEIQQSVVFKEGKGLEDRTRPNALFLSVAAQFNGEIASDMLEWMNRIWYISGLGDGNHLRFTAEKLDDPTYHKLIQDMVHSVDPNILDLRMIDMASDILEKTRGNSIPDELRQQLRNVPELGFSIKTRHQKYKDEHEIAGDVEFNLMKDGSAGTQRFLAFTGPVLQALREGSVLIVDELEARLHPRLSMALLGLFNSSSNSKNAQILFATHEDDLLDSKRIRRDQVWFAEKDDYGASRLYSLAEFKVRKESKFAKEYLLGQFGAVPRLRDFLEVSIHGSE